MRYWIVLFLLCCVGCTFWGQSAYYDAEGILHQGTPGVIDDVISGLTVASPFAPFAGLAATVLSIVGGVGTALTARKGRKDDAKVTALLIEGIKDNVGKLANDKQVVKFVNDNIPKEKAYGKLLHSAYESLKKQGDIK